MNTMTNHDCRERDRAYYLAHRESIREKQPQYSKGHRERNKERLRQRDREYYMRNRERIGQQQRKYYLARGTHGFQGSLRFMQWRFRQYMKLLERRIQEGSNRLAAMGMPGL